MRRKILTAIAAVLGVALVAFVWRLDLPHWKKLDLTRITDMGSATEVYDAEGQPAGTLHGGQVRRWVSIDSIPAHVQDAFIAAEDARFYSHHGVDVRRMLAALWHDVTTLSYDQGASTITQQLVKLTHLSGVKTLSRKAQEIALALRLERVMSKREILQAYLNTVYFGHGAYGIEAAANAYFGKSSGELTLAEGALLAGVIKSPSGYAPHLNPERSVSRRNTVLTAMADRGFISEGEAEAARGEPLRLVESPDDAHFAWYMDAVLSEAAAALRVSTDEVYTGGYRIYTGFDPEMQRAAEELCADAESFPPDAGDGTPTQVAFIALSTDTGEVRAVIGGRRYEVALGLNRATGTRRQPGSAFKPVSTYAAAIDAFGFVPSSTVEDTPREFDGGYSPRNAGGASYGTVTLREALSRSLNIATVDLAALIGTEAVRTYALRFGLPLSTRDASLSMALGALTDGVSPAELAAAYCALANGGTRVKAHFIREIRDMDGDLLYAAEVNGTRAVKDSTAYMLTDMLKTAAASGSARALVACGMPVAGKTGTVSEPGDAGTRDVWTAAYTPDLAVCAWMGFDRPDADHALASSEGGSGYPARLCAAFLKAVSARLSGRDFSWPASVKAVMVDRVALEERHTALLVTENTPSEYAVLELFHEGDVPGDYSDNWSAPKRVSDLRLLTGPGETPVLSFTAVDAAAEYLVLRTTEGRTRQIAVLSGSPGEELRFADTGHDLSQPADYAVMPRNARLFAAGTLLTAPQTPSVHYAPGGFLNKLMGAGAAEATQAPMEAAFPEESLFD